MVAVSSMGGFLGRHGVGEGAESEERTVSKGGNVILSAEYAVVQPNMSGHVSYECIGIFCDTCSCVILHSCVFLMWHI